MEPTPPDPADLETSYLADLDPGEEAPRPPVPPADEPDTIRIGGLVFTILPF